jgi:cytochrome c553
MKKTILIVFVITLVSTIIGSNYFWFNYYSVIKNEIAAITEQNQKLKDDNVSLLSFFSLYEESVASKEAQLAQVREGAEILLSDIKARQSTENENARLAALESQLSEQDIVDCAKFACATIVDGEARDKCVSEKIACYENRLKMTEELKILRAQIQNDEKIYQQLIEEAKKEAESMNK